MDIDMYMFSVTLSYPILTYPNLTYPIIFSSSLSIITWYSILKRIAYTGQVSLIEDASMKIMPSLPFSLSPFSFF